MKSRVLFLIALVVSSVNALAQNLVPNGGFEEVVQCPNTLSDLHFECSNWYMSIQIPNLPFDQHPSPDFFHTCALNNGIVPPNTVVGFQSPYEGNAYSGLVFYDDDTENYREIMGVELTQTMIIGASYQISFRAVRAHTQTSEDMATNKHGVKFSTFPSYSSSSECINNQAHFSIDSLVVDSLNWNLFSFSFTADSAYQYLHVGSFFTDDQIDTASIGNGFSQGAYYFFDDVSIVQDLTNNLITKEVNHELRLWPVPVTDILFFDISGIADRLVKVEVFDLVGKIVSESISSKKDHIDLQQLPKGLYCIRISNKAGNYFIKQFIKF